MAKSLVLLAVCFFVQVSYAIDMAIYYNDTILSQLELCEKLQAEPESATYVDDLQQLAQVLEGGLKLDLADEKSEILDGIENQFSPQFISWFFLRRDKERYNYKIQREIEFYEWLLTINGEHATDITAAITTLKNIFNETDLEKQQKNFLDLRNTFSDDFKTFVDEIKPSKITEEIEKLNKFLERLLKEKDIKFETEIKELKARTDYALKDNMDFEDQIAVFYDILLIENDELDEYLGTKTL